MVCGMELHQAEHLVAVVEHGSFSRAAQALFISQPTISFSIRAIRDEIGAEVFVPARRPLALTPDGEAVVLSARRLLAGAQAARTAVRRAISLASGSLVLAIDAEALADPVAGLLGAFRAKFPGTELRLLDPGRQETALLWLTGFQCEVAIVLGPILTTSLSVTPIQTQTLGLVAHPSVKLPESDPVSLRDLAQVPLILPPAPTPTRILITDAFDQSGIRPRIAVECGPRDAIRPLVESGAGAAFCQPVFVQEAHRSGLLTRRTHPEISREVFVVHRPGPISPALAHLLELAGGLADVNAGARPPEGNAEPDH